MSEILAFGNYACPQPADHFHDAALRVGIDHPPRTAFQDFDGLGEVGPIAVEEQICLGGDGGSVYRLHIGKKLQRRGPLSRAHRVACPLEVVQFVSDHTRGHVDRSPSGLFIGQAVAMDFRRVLASQSAWR